MNRAVFLDRDGTINEDIGYPRSMADIRIFPESFEAIRRLNEAGFYILVVTNQSAVGRGWLKEKELEWIHEQMKVAFKNQGARIDAFYYCPHWINSSDPEYSQPCPCRKPGTALGERAALEFKLDLSQCFMVGDKLDDILFGHRLGMKSILVLTGQGQQTLDNLNWLKNKIEAARKNFEATPARADREKEEKVLFEREKSLVNFKDLIQREQEWSKLWLRVEEIEPDKIASNILEAAHWIIENSQLAGLL